MMLTIEIRAMRPEDEEAARSFCCKHFTTRAPMERNLQVDPDVGGSAWFYAVFPDCLEEGLSVVAIDTATEEIVGFQIIGVVHKDKPHIFRLSKDDPKSRGVALTYEALNNAYKGFDIYVKYDVDKLANIQALCVGESYCGQGIATKMVANALELIRAKNIRLITVETTNRFSSQVFQKFGFDKLVEQRYDTMILDGKPLQMTDDLRFHEYLTVYAKAL